MGHRLPVRMGPGSTWTPWKGYAQTLSVSVFHVDTVLVTASVCPCHAETGACRLLPEILS